MLLRFSSFELEYQSHHSIVFLKKTGTLRAKVADFGLSKITDCLKSVVRVEERLGSSKIDSPDRDMEKASSYDSTASASTTNVGTPQYMVLTFYFVPCHEVNNFKQQIHAHTHTHTGSRTLQ